MNFSNPGEVVSQLWRAGDQSNEQPHIFVILDASRNPKIYPTLKSSFAEYTCLYKGAIPKALAEVAPSLVRLSKDRRFEGGAECYFRFYDPRVFRVYLPSCNSTELEDMFGPVTRFFIEGEDRNTLLEYSLAGRKLSQKTIQLNAVATTIKHDR